MKAILIDPFTQTISPVEMETGQLDEIYSLLKCTTIDAVGMPEFDNIANVMFVDDVGLHVRDQRYFQLKHYPQPYGGRGLIMGVNNDLDCTETSTTLPIETLEPLVSWPDVEFVGEETETSENQNTFFMKVTPVFRQR
jgi:hypothetical protein